MKIQWYPGHMARAKRLLSEQMSKCDFIIELADARIPASSRNDELIKLCGAKRRLLVLSKCDLAEPKVNEQWLDFYKAQGEYVFAYDAQAKSTKALSSFVNKHVKELMQKSLDRGFKKTIRGMVIGMPNVGKSTIINRLCGAAITSVANTPGHTKANRWVKVNPYMELMDSPGIMLPKIEDELKAQRIAYIGTIKDAVYNTDELCLLLLEELMQKKPKELMERFKIKDENLEKGIDILEAICRGRGFIMKGKECDWDRAIAVVLEEFRSGKIARISLEKPNE